MERGQLPPATSSTPSFRLLEAAWRAAASLAQDTGRVSDKVLWSLGKMLLSAGESVNYVWDAALHATVGLLKAGGAACGSIADRLAHVPVIGYGASGVRQAVGVAVDAVASNVAHDTLVRSQAFAALNAKLNESGARLRPATAATATTDHQRGPVPHCFTAEVISPDPAAADTADAATNPTTAVTDPTTEAADPTTTATDPTTAAAADHPLPADESKPSTFSKVKVELYKSISSLGRGAGIMIKALGQAALSVMGFLFGAVEGINKTTAFTGEKVASVVGLVNNATSRVVLVRDLTSGAATLATGMASTHRKNTEFNIKSRRQLFDKLDNAMDNYHPESEPFLIAPAVKNGSADGKTTDTTVTEAAPATALPVQT